MVFAKWGIDADGEMVFVCGRDSLLKCIEMLMVHEPIDGGSATVMMTCLSITPINQKVGRKTQKWAGEMGQKKIMLNLRS